MNTTTSATAPSTTEPPNWAELPRDILTRIASHLDYTTDLPRLRGVCPQWRASLHPSNLPKQPTHFNVSFFKVPPYNNHPLHLLQTRFYFLSPLSSPGPLNGKWLVRVGEIGPGKFHLYNPLNFHDYFFPTPPLVGEINLLDCRTVLELARPFCLLGGPRRDHRSGQVLPLAKKVVGGLGVGPSGQREVSLLAQIDHHRGGEGGGLIIWRLRDKEWTEIDEDGELRVLDTAYYKGKFFAFSLKRWDVGLLDPEKPDLSSMEFIGAPEILTNSIDDMFCVKVDGVTYNLRDVYLVVSGDKSRLYLAVEAGQLKSKSEKGEMFVYVLKVVDNVATWEMVRDYSDEIFFFGYDVAFTVPSSALPQWQPGSFCIFTRPFPLFFDGRTRGFGKRLPKGCERLERVSFADYWRYFRLFSGGKSVRFEKLSKDVYTGLFFPPPSWVRWQCPRLGNVEVKVDGLKFGDNPDEDRYGGMSGGGGGSGVDIGTLLQESFKFELIKDPGALEDILV